MSTDEATIERLKIVAAVFSVLNELQGLTDKPMHGADVETHINIAENRGHSPMARLEGDTRTFEAWDIYVYVTCSDFFDYATGDAEGIDSWNDFELFHAAANAFVERIPAKPHFENPKLEHGVGWKTYMSDELADELHNWLGWSFCILKNKYRPLPQRVEQMPAWLMPALEEIATNKGFEIRPNYNEKWYSQK